MLRKVIVGLTVGLMTVSGFASNSDYNANNLFERNQKNAILVTHFGTTVDSTRAKTIDVMNKKIKEAYPNVEVREAYSSRIIARKLAKRGIIKLNPLEALEKLKNDGYTNVIVQPTNIINGIEADNLLQDINDYKDEFIDIRMGTPLLTHVEDYQIVAKTISKRIGETEKKEGVLVVGHGTTNQDTAAYAMMNDYFQRQDEYKNFFVGVIEGYPVYEDVLKSLRKTDIKEINLMPFMFVAGDHAKNDIAGVWKERLEKEGYKVNVILEGLAERPRIQTLFLEHIEFAENYKKIDMQKKKKMYKNGMQP